MENTPTILHVDLNSYFATVEQQQNPRLRGKPVGIVKDLGRACVIAASREAKQEGVKTGFSVFEARLLCPRLVLIKADFDKYLHYTKAFFSLIRSFTPEVHLFSLDEAFLDASGCVSLYGSAELLAESIQQRIFQRLGGWVTASIGIAENYMLAKLAGDRAPKGGHFRITRRNLDRILATARPTDICGIGPRIAEKLAGLGVSNVTKIRRLSDKALRYRFGPFWGPQLKRISWGGDSHLFSFLDRNQHMKGVGRTITGLRLCDDEDEIRRVIRNLVEEATLKLRQMEMAGREVSIFLEGGTPRPQFDGRGEPRLKENRIWYRHRTLKYYVRHPDEVFDLLYLGFYRNWRRAFPIIRFGVRVGLLEPMEKIPTCWLPSWKKRENLWQAVDAINKKYGFLNVRCATLLRGNIIRPEVTGYLGDKLFQMKEEEAGMLY